MNIQAWLQGWRHFGKVYRSYEEALKACGKTYEEKELVDWVVGRTIRFKESIEREGITMFPNAYASYFFLGLLRRFANGSGNTIRVLDFGGAAGALYFQIRSLLPKNLQLLWAVVETPLMAQTAKPALANSELAFFSSLNDAQSFLQNIDCLHTSATLQAVPNPYQTLQQLFALNAQTIILNRAGFNQNHKDVFTVHHSKLSWNGIGPLPERFEDKWVTYPYGFMSEKAFWQSVPKEYKLVLRWEDNSGCYPVWGEKIVGYGLMLEKI